MASIATSTHLPVLGEPHQHKEVGHVLEATLHELVDLSLIGKQLHWAVVGPLFTPLHMHLDELVDSWRELADTVAERAVALGYVPDGQARAVSRGSRLSHSRRSRITRSCVSSRIASLRPASWPVAGWIGWGRSTSPPRMS
jgi:DNA-binding ferritin-like protein